jgi:hypothetical protein
VITGQTDSAFQAEVFPNPAEDYLSFTFSGISGRFVDVQIVSQDGKVMDRFKVDTRKPVHSIKTRSYPAGVYIYKAFDQAGGSISGKVSIVH